MSAESGFYVHEGGIGGNSWKQIGTALNETPNGIWTDGNDVFTMVSRNDAVGLACRTLPTTADSGEQWQNCDGFPDYSSPTGYTPFAVRGTFVENSQDLIAWFEMKNMDEPTIILHGRTESGEWPELGSEVLPRPAAWAFQDTSTSFGFLGEETPSLLYGVTMDGDFAPMYTDGLPVPDNPFSGVMGICPTTEYNYVLYVDYSSNYSMVHLYRQANEI